MILHKILENPTVYNLCQKALSIIALGNKGMANFMRSEFAGAKTVLEVGCGTGRFANIFGQRYTGVDYNGAYIKHAQNKFPAAKFYVSDSSSLAFMGKKFDTVFSICTFHHLSNEQVVNTIIEMEKVANNSVYVIDPVYPPAWNILGYILFKMDRGFYRRTFNKMRNLLEPMGYQVRQESLPNSFPYKICVFNKIIK